MALREFALTRLVATLLLCAGLGWFACGCGGTTILPVAGSNNSGITLADSATGARLDLSVVSGAFTLTDAGNSGTVSPEVALIDSVTGSRDSLGVTSGALGLVPASGSELAASQIVLTDTVTAKSYALAVASGSLTLIPN
jgi:hypothetical protein